jgi:hypothetical protein
MSIRPYVYVDLNCLGLVGMGLALVWLLAYGLWAVVRVSR